MSVKGPVTFKEKFYWTSLYFGRYKRLLASIYSKNQTKPEQKCTSKCFLKNVKRTCDTKQKKSQNGRDVLIALEVKIQTAVRQFRSRGTDIYE